MPCGTCTCTMPCGPAATLMSLVFVVRVPVLCLGGGKRPDLSENPRLFSLSKRGEVARPLALARLVGAGAASVGAGAALLQPGQVGQHRQEDVAEDDEDEEAAKQLELHVAPPHAPLERDRLPLEGGCLRAEGLGLILEHLEVVARSEHLVDRVVHDALDLLDLPS